MRLDLVSFRGTAPTGAGTSLLAEWRVGTILQAVAVRDAKTGQLWLELSGERHPARIASGDQQGPAHGERLQVRVLRTHPVLALETLSSSEQIDDHTQAAADALRRFVPKQESPTMMLANLAWLARGKGASQALPRGVLEAAARLWQSIPDADSLTDPKSLQAALERSGAFLEAKLASSPSRAAIATDLKALMLSLSRALQESGARPSAARSDIASHAPLATQRGPLTTLNAAPATLSLLDAPAQQLNELSRQIEGALARLTTVQIANSAPDHAHSILVELPIRHDDRASVMRLRIEQDDARKHECDADSAWSVEAALDLGPIGSLHARVTLRGQRVGVQLRADSPGVVEALASRAGDLEAILRDVGLEVDRVVCLHGMPAGDTGVRPTRLLDVRA
ncbi:MAG: flagellar hook-length control protein FliK [Xanthomonadaceae bacterium]|nr:flagellar hook-length control protein FliK [Xanthomonadaceae bacterium]